MKFCLMINASEQWQASSECALSLAKSITAAGHTINTVFFYGQAIHVVEQPNQLKQWQLWQRLTQTPLMLCSTLIENQQLTAVANQAKGFETVSMGRWVQALEAADKMVELS